MAQENREQNTHITTEQEYSKHQGYIWAYKEHMGRQSKVTNQQQKTKPAQETKKQTNSPNTTQ